MGNMGKRSAKTVGWYIGSARPTLIIVAVGPLGRPLANACANRARTPHRVFLLLGCFLGLLASGSRVSLKLLQKLGFYVMLVFCLCSKHGQTHAT